MADEKPRGFLYLVDAEGNFHKGQTRTDRPLDTALIQPSGVSLQTSTTKELVEYASYSLDLGGTASPVKYHLTHVLCHIQIHSVDSNNTPSIVPRFFEQIALTGIAFNLGLFQFGETPVGSEGDSVSGGWTVRTAVLLANCKVHHCGAYAAGSDPRDPSSVVLRAKGVFAADKDAGVDVMRNIENPDAEFKDQWDLHG